jgi:hypothetical protein
MGWIGARSCTADPAEFPSGREMWQADIRLKGPMAANGKIARIAAETI